MRRRFPEPSTNTTANDLPPLPPLDEELWWHGGSYLYAPEGDHLNWPDESSGEHYQVLRLPESWHAPQPLTFGDDFLGTGPIPYHPRLKWPGMYGYAWDPHTVVYGSYSLIGMALEADQQRYDLVAHQLLLDVDCHMTGTERIHVQWRPFGERNTGGSYYRINTPQGYVDNSTGIPERYWFEGELASIFGGLLVDQFTPRDYHMVLGKFPFLLHNGLLMNDEILGFVVNKNTIYLANLSNLNVQAFSALDDLDVASNESANLYGLHISADLRRLFFELTYAFVDHDLGGERDTQYAAFSATKVIGAATLSGRVFFKWGDPGGRGEGQLYVVEANRKRPLDGKPLGIEKLLLYATAFRATDGWNPISGGNFDRLRISFALDPLMLISAGGIVENATGVTLGIQLFRHHDDESIIPEVAFDSIGGASVLGVGLRYQRKIGKRSFLEMRGIGNFSDNPQYQRDGVFVSQNILF